MAKVKVVVVGGGFSGIAAAVAAGKSGAQTTLIERTDLLSGAGLRAGRMNYNGKFVAAEEAKALGGGEVFEALESIILHRANIVDEENGYVYNTARVDVTMRALLARWGVSTRLEARVIEVRKKGNPVYAVILEGGEAIEADVFVDATGTRGGLDMCNLYGNGCSMCLYRCPTFGNRVSIATKAGAPEMWRTRPDGQRGALDSAMLLYKASLAPDLMKRLEKDGVVTIPLPPELVDYSKQQRIGAARSRRQMENLNLVDIGLSAKCVGSGPVPLDDLRKIPGLEAVLVEHPIGGGKVYAVNQVSMNSREPSLQARGVPNVMLAGTKAGPGGGIAEAITFGVLAGHNAVRQAAGRALLVLPRTTMIGDFIEFTGEMMNPAGLTKSYSYAHDVYWKRLNDLGFYTTDAGPVHQRIKKTGLAGVLGERVAG